MAGGLDAVLAAVAAAGYTAVETVNDHGIDVGEMQDLLEKYNLTVSSSHVGIQVLQEKLAHVINFNKFLGNPVIAATATASVCHGPCAMAWASACHCDSSKASKATPTMRRVALGRRSACMRWREVEAARRPIAWGGKGSHHATARRRCRRRPLQDGGERAHAPLPRAWRGRRARRHEGEADGARLRPSGEGRPRAAATAAPDRGRISCTDALARARCRLP